MPPTFRALGVPPALTAALQSRGIEHPFPVQAATIPDSLAGHDLCGRAPTGSGKTLAFGIPLVARISPARPKRPTGLVLVPARELALQVQDALVPLAMAQRLYVLAVYGGAPAARQIRSLDRGASIVVATPGRLIDLVDQGAVSLDAVEVVVLDEADRMADMGFLPQVRRLVDTTPSTRQTMLWSATLDGEVDVLIRDYLRDPRHHDVAAEPEQTGDVRHHFWSTDKIAKVGVAANLVRDHGSALVFVRTKHGADRLARQLTAAGVDAVPIHGDRSQRQRERALDDFRQGRAQALVATDVAARGIHIDRVPLVVHWDPVDDPKDHVHRSGRTGRAGADGVVVSLVTPEARAKTTAVQRALGLPVGLEAAPSGAVGQPALPTKTATTPRRQPRRPAEVDVVAPEPSSRPNRKTRRAHLQPAAVPAKSATPRRHHGDDPGRRGNVRRTRRTARP